MISANARAPRIAAGVAAKLKVFRTAIGFHDAYVAASSQKAALEAWGTDKPLFARGAAEVVTDPALTAEPLTQPGTVIKRLRGSEAEQIAALPPDGPRPARKLSDASAPSKAAKAKPKPKPSRSALNAAEQAVSDAEARHGAELEQIEARERALREERHKLEQQQAVELERLAAARDTARKRYDTALRRWHGNER